MDATISKLDLRTFYPEDSFEISECCVNDTGVLVRLKSKKQNCECPRCHQISNYYHGTYKRFVQDLPILGKNTSVIITAHEYECQNEECPTKTIAEHFDHFLGYYGRFTERCEDFISTLALETSCEGASRICGHLGIQISGDTIIRMLKKRFSQMEIETAGSCIGIDDFSTKKGNTYCTVVCNTDSHRPIAVLEGRDGSSLKEWLKKNKHVKTVTRDRASAYAKVINEEIPDAMQIADRFHLHQNLLEIIKKCISSNLPQTIRVESDCDHNDARDISEKVTQNSGTSDDTSKKNAIQCG